MGLSIGDLPIAGLESNRVRERERAQSSHNSWLSDRSLGPEVESLNRSRALATAPVP